MLAAVDEDRKFIYQATIVRLMKARKVGFFSVAPLIRVCGASPPGAPSVGPHGVSSLGDHKADQRGGEDGAEGRVRPQLMGTVDEASSFGARSHRDHFAKVYAQGARSEKGD